MKHLYIIGLFLLPVLSTQARDEDAAILRDSYTWGSGKAEIRIGVCHTNGYGLAKWTWW